MIFRSITLQEANLFLPLLKEHFSKIHVLVGEGQVLHGRMLNQSSQTDISGGIHTNEDSELLKTQLDQIEHKIRDEMMELSYYGAIIKSVFPARVDFRSERHKQPVYLCWQTGDSQVSHWHPVDEGFATRRFIHQPQEFGPTVIH
ncbi:MAG: DUF2203 domain-containing protein [Myxococcaceae bacterium]